MNKKLLTLLPFLFLIQFAHAQTWQKISTVKVSGNIAVIDNLNNVYVYNQRVIEKYNIAGKLLFTYSSTSSANITKIDVLNPMQLLVYYAEINQLIFLDNTLSESGAALQLSNIDFQQTTQVCNSANKGFWIFNTENIELIHLSNELEILSRTGNLALLLNKQINPTLMQETGNKLYVSNAQNTFVFDNFGTYQKSIPIPAKNISITESAIYFFEDNKMEKYNLNDARIEEILLPHPLLNYFYNGQYLASVENMQLTIWHN